MRPRPDAAENCVNGLDQAVYGIDASMRPRPDAAENAPCRPCLVYVSDRFNEAAARCRGKLSWTFRPCAFAAALQ